MSKKENLPPASPDVSLLTPEDAVADFLEEAAALEASDLFLTPNGDDFTVAVRHLGIVKPLARTTPEHGIRLIAHVKALAGMDVAKKQRPQDGRWLHQCADGRRIDLRINTIPSLYGEDMALRLLVRDSQLRQLDSLGFVRRQYNDMLGLLNSPSGLILVSGPTGSGKTTTLYAFLQYLNDGRRKINTIEDPIEYALAGVRQSQANEKLGVDFPELLRSVLRQSPDVIMIGEIRDPVTARTAVWAANSGHLVFATLHAPTAAGAVQSMLSLGCHPHFLANSLLGAVSQRLVRTLCPKCRNTIDLSESPETFSEIAEWLAPEERGRLYSPGKCEACRFEGYAGRTGCFEVLTTGREMRRQIARLLPAEELEQIAIANGMIPFQKVALLKIAQGATTTEEILRVVPGEQLGLEE
ncbi:MAG: GspE/PulE family protein [Pirellulales bacterium]